MHAVRLLLLYDGLTDWLTRNRWAIDCLHATWQNVGMECGMGRFSNMTVTACREQRCTSRTNTSLIDWKEEPWSRAVSLDNKSRRSNLIFCTGCGFLSNEYNLIVPAQNAGLKSGSEAYKLSTEPRRPDSRTSS
jgi:hypothetical protein